MTLVAQATWMLQMAGLERTEASNTEKQKVDSAGSRHLQTNVHVRLITPPPPPDLVLRFGLMEGGGVAMINVAGGGRTR